ncbi:MAG TPA: RNA polymerase sigma factor [Thermomicrobiales bacterium]|nr:RNA polymerase sigma factor [Thermomicrobiales bacterium]
MPADTVQQRVDAIYRADSRRVYATLVRLFGGDFELAEDAMHEAFAVAVERWSQEGMPDNPYAWLVSTGRFKAIDTIRRRNRFGEMMPELHREQEAIADIVVDGESIEDDRLRLIFTCCHPALPEDARVALTLREVCGLTTEEIARAYLTAPSTLAQRIVRAKTRIRKEGIPYQVPEPEELPERLDAVLRVVYLVFNEGYAASFGPSLTRPDLSDEAIRLGRLLKALLGDPEATGLLALMLLNEARRPARTSPEGDLVPLEEQDRALWDHKLISEGRQLVDEALATRRIGPYTLQAAIAAEHAKAPSFEATDWSRIVALYELLGMLAPSPVVELNRAAAVAMRDDPDTGLTAMDAILDRGDLADYHLAHAARADLLRRLGRVPEARDAYERALQLEPQERERRLLKRRLAELEG